MDVSETKGFRLFPINIAKHLNNKEAYTYLVLLFKSDFETGESNVLLETLSKETGYMSETVSNYLHKAEECKFVKITPHHGTKVNGSPKTKNYYKVVKPTKDFIIVNREFLDLHFESLSLKEETDLKGFILLVKCLCLNNCNLTYYSLREMDKYLKISYSTIQSLMKKCRELNLIVYDDKECYIIILDCFDLGNTGYFSKDTPANYKDIYNEIASFCQSKGFQAPPYDSKYIGMIITKYPTTKKEIIKIYQQTGDKEFVKKNLISYQLAKKLPKLSEPINSLNYFVKVLLNRKYEKPPKREPYTYYL